MPLKGGKKTDLSPDTSTIETQTTNKEQRFGSALPELHELETGQK